MAYVLTLFEVDDILGDITSVIRQRVHGDAGYQQRAGEEWHRPKGPGGAPLVGAYRSLRTPVQPEEKIADGNGAEEDQGLKKQRVDLPQQEGPMNAETSFAPISRSTAARATDFLITEASK
jgi:hypothetical protein